MDVSAAQGTLPLGRLPFLTPPLASSQVFSPNVTAFAQRGGKVLHYVGYEDQLITAGNSVSCEGGLQRSRHRPCG
jgi:hypothetical protein